MIFPANLYFTRFKKNLSSLNSAFNCSKAYLGQKRMKLKSVSTLAKVESDELKRKEKMQGGRNKQ